MKRTKKMNTKWMLIASLVVLITATVSGVVAYIIARTATVSNEFTPVKVTCKIEETFKDNVKSDVYIRNTGDVDAYLRAVVIANWVSDSGDGKVLAVMPSEGTDYSIEWGMNDWKKSSDGYWYFAKAVASQGVTGDLIEKAVVLAEVPEGYHLQIQVLATAIQAQPEHVVEQEWGVTVENGILSLE